ncbi:MAG: hypothetical protein K0B87_00595 [Candidatus Syntrophosphaera sp.]|nr:hypothetical protein [Candidatus Syntrophosphaera sp.]
MDICLKRRGENRSCSSIYRQAGAAPVIFKELIMKLYLTLFLLIGLGACLSAQETFAWAVCTDAWGHCYVTGFFYSTISFGFTELTAYGLYNYEDIFVARLDPQRRRFAAPGLLFGKDGAPGE